MPPSADIHVVSYPKAGRTWLRVLLGRALCVHYGLERTLILDTPRLTEAAGLPRTDLHHDGSELGAELDYRSLPDDKLFYRDKKVVLLVRDPRDVLVSSYFEATRRSFLFDGRPVEFEGPLSAFIRSPVFGARKVARFHDIWARSLAVPKSFLLVRYEHLRAAPEQVLSGLLAFLGAGDLPSRRVSEAVAYGSLHNMRRLERANAFRDPRLQPGNPSDPESYKVRRGRVGGYVDYLSRVDIEYVERELDASPLSFSRQRQDLGATSFTCRRPSEARSSAGTA